MAQIKPNLFVSVHDISSFLDVPTEKIESTAEELLLKTVSRGGKAHLKPEDARKICRHFGRAYKSNVLSVQMLKGGVAKTTTALNLALRARMYGLRVLMIDLDQQANLTYALGCEDTSSPVWIDILEGRSTLVDARILIDEGLHLIASNLDNSILERVLTSGMRNVPAAVRQYLDSVREVYDLVVIDTAPNLSAINTAVSCASDTVLLPVNPDRFSFQGLQLTLSELDRIQSEFYVQFTPKIVFTRFDGRESSSKEYLRACYESYRDRMLQSFVRTASDVKNTIRSGKTVFDSKSNAKEDFDLLTREILHLTQVEGE